jgi:hypothetical protein
MFADWMDVHPLQSSYILWGEQRAFSDVFVTVYLFLSLPFFKFLEGRTLTCLGVKSITKHIMRAHKV